MIDEISVSTELLAWLRKKRNDREFVTAVEMSMGKGEMECPAELWLEEPGQPGRPDEEKLSMLQTVRAKLHAFIYREQDLFDNLDLALDALDAVGHTDARLVVYLRECSRLLGPLQEAWP